MEIMFAAEHQWHRKGSNIVESLQQCQIQV
jgi:hypothetical protein